MRETRAAPAANTAQAALATQVSTYSGTCGKQWWQRTRSSSAARPTSPGLYSRILIQRHSSSIRSRGAGKRGGGAVACSTAGHADCICKPCDACKDEWVAAPAIPPSNSRPLDVPTCMVAVEGGAPHERHCKHALPAARLVAAAGTGGLVGRWQWRAATARAATAALLLLLLLALLPGGGGVKSRLKCHVKAVQEPVGCEGWSRGSMAGVKGRIDAAATQPSSFAQPAALALPTRMQGARLSPSAGSCGRSGG